MRDKDLGTATIVYDHPGEGTVERTVDNDHIAYFQDHWLLRHDEDASGNDIVRRIPVQRVHYVDRSVEQFEDEVATLRNQVESFAEDIRSKVLGGHGGDETQETSKPIEIDVESEDGDDS